MQPALNVQQNSVVLEVDEGGAPLKAASQQSDKVTFNDATPPEKATDSSKEATTTGLSNPIKEAEFGKKLSQQSNDKNPCNARQSVMPRRSVRPSVIDASGNLRRHTVRPSRKSIAGRVSSRPSSIRVNKAFSMGNTSALVDAHETVDLDDVADHADLEDDVNLASDYIKAFVLGGLDGIVSTFALVAGLGGAKVDIATLIAVSLAKILADAFSMGFGEYTSASAELEANIKLMDREQWEMENHMEGEVKEMAELYMQRGCSKEDALTILSMMSKYNDLFLEHMMVMEHEIMMPDDDDKWQPLKQGLVCFLAFASFGMVPLVGFIVYYAISGDDADEGGPETVLGIAYALTTLTLFTMGLTKAKLTSNPGVLKSGLMMVINGTFAGAGAYLIGELMAGLL